MYAGACYVAGASVPARASLPPPPHRKEARVKIRAYHNTPYVPVHNIAVIPPNGKEACVKMRPYHNTHYVPLHNMAVDEKPAYGVHTRHR